MSRVKLAIATTDYDHFRDFRLGVVNAEGIDQTWLTLGHHEVFARFTFNREWDVSELSFAKFCAQVTRTTPDIIGLPVVCSRLFRFSSFYVNRHSKIQTAADLRGKTIGSPEWAHTAAVYMRGWLNDEHGVGLHDVHWYQAGANEAGRSEKVELNLPKGVKLTRVNDKSLSEMIATGEIDCALIARPPNSFLQGHPDVVRLFPNYLEMEESYYERTKVWPIMHNHRDPDPGAGRASLGRAQPLQCLRRVEAAQSRAPARSRGLALSTRVVADLRAQDARPLRR
jgi:4,5-dihydroxyphthalate decarboxylase